MRVLGNLWGPAVHMWQLEGGGPAKVFDMTLCKVDWEEWCGGHS